MNEVTMKSALSANWVADNYVYELAGQINILIALPPK